MDRLKLCLVHMPRLVVQALREAGHEVLEIAPQGGGDLDLSRALSGFAPDLLIQVESLGPRLLLRGLEDLSCRKLFWAVDPHLNGFWQAAYARLFDAVCSTQARWHDDLQALGASEVRFLPWFAVPGPWTPWEGRRWDVAFVGRVTIQRPARRWLTEYLSGRLPAGTRLFLASDLPYAAMLEAYRDSRLVPNESIMGEINFRLFEAAGCGCLVLGQDLGPEQAALFEPGREMEVAAHVLEFEERIGHLLGNPREAALKARAAWEAVQARHLPGHRAASLLEIAASCGDRAETGPGAAVWEGLARVQLFEAGRWPLTPEQARNLLNALPPEPPVLAARVRLAARHGAPEETRALLTALLAGGAAAGDTALDLAGSMAALRLDLWDLARQFWYRRLRADKTGHQAEPPADPVHLCLLWARFLRARGPVLRSGFPFDPALDLPASAAECLLLALTLRPGDVDLTREMNQLLASRPGLDQLRLAYLSDLTLRRRRDWRLGLDIALADLKCFRLEAGLEELRLARRQALAEGRERAFGRALAGRDPGGLLARTLG